MYRIWNKWERRLWILDQSVQNCEKGHKSNKSNFSQLRHGDHAFSHFFFEIFFSQDLTKKRQCQRQWQRQWHILSEILRIFEILIMMFKLRIRIHDNHCDVYFIFGVEGQGIICVCCQQILKTQSLKICRRLTGHCATAMHKSNLESMKNQARHRNGWSWSHSSGSVWCSSLSFCWSGHIFSSLCCLDNLFSTKFIESSKKSHQKSLVMRIYWRQSIWRPIGVTGERFVALHWWLCHKSNDLKP